MADEFQRDPAPPTEVEGAEAELSKPNSEGREGEPYGESSDLDGVAHLGTTSGGDGDLVDGSPSSKKKKKKKGKQKEDPKARTPRGVETMFRTSYRTHLDLSALADNKANIMISINGIIMSILLASIYPRIMENRWLLLPTTVLLVGCLISMIYAVLSARPRVTRNPVTLDDVRAGKANILFFGNFISLEEDEYVEGMKELIQDPDRAYGSMSRDIYGLGGVLERKYRLLRASYTVFMFGLIAGVVLFLTVFAMAGGNSALI